MLPLSWTWMGNPFTMEEEEEKEEEEEEGGGGGGGGDQEISKISSRFNHATFSPRINKGSSDSLDVGLRILIQLNSHVKSSNAVVKPTLKLKKPTSTFVPNQIDPGSTFYGSSFLKSCFLCNKNLSPDQDVYMYRGDQGFCSVECRSRQIYLDEMKEIEASTKKMVESFRRCRRPSDRCESSTRALLEEFRQLHNNNNYNKPLTLSSQKDRPIVVLL